MKFDMKKIISECRREINFSKQLSGELKHEIYEQLIREHTKMHENKTCPVHRHRDKLKEKSTRWLSKMLTCDSKRLTKRDVKL